MATQLYAWGDGGGGGTGTGNERTVAVAVGKDARVPVLFDLTAVEPGKAALRFSVDAGEGDAVELTLTACRSTCRSPSRSRPVPRRCIRICGRAAPRASTRWVYGIRTPRFRQAIFCCASV